MLHPSKKSNVQNKLLLDKDISLFKKDLIKHGVSCDNNLKSFDDFQKYLRKASLNIFDLKKRKKEKKLLSVELNFVHDVLRPSIYKYFSALGYEVDFLLIENEDNKRWNFFERFKSISARTVTGSYLFINAVLSSDDMKEYDFILFNTPHIFAESHGNEVMYCVDSLRLNTGKIPQPKYGFITIPPHPSLRNTEERDALVQTKLLNGIPVLTQSGYRGLPMLCNHHFGDVNITPKSTKNIFLASGSKNPDLKNQKILLEAAEKLIDEGTTNFEIIMTGGLGTIDIPSKLESHLRLTGDSKPAELFKLIEECDFITALMDSNTEWHKKNYAHGTCSTAFHFSLGFAKPYIIEDYFLESYDIDQSAVISHKNQDLYSAMKRAILMDSYEYKQIQSNILKERQRRNDRSFSDLQQVLEEAKKRHTYFKKLIRPVIKRVLKFLR